MSKIIHTWERKMPKISVLMPVYKTKEEYLRQAIESVLAQTFTDFEFLILDDCPEDDREKIVKSYADKRIKYFKNEKNLGISEARNKLVTLAKGEYLAIVDHDDISLPARFEKEAAYLDAHPEVGVVSANKKTIIKHRQTSFPQEDHQIKLALMYSCVLIHPAALIRKKVLTRNGIFYDKIYSPSEDYALWCNLIPYTQFHVLDEVLIYYRDHNTNTSHTQENQMHLAAARIRAENIVRYKALWEEYKLAQTRICEIKFLGLPLLKITSKNRKTKVYLFNKILIFKWYIKYKIA